MNMSHFSNSCKFGLKNLVVCCLTTLCLHICTLINRYFGYTSLCNKYVFTVCLYKSTELKIGERNVEISSPLTDLRPDYSQLSHVFAL